jgi:hypothetical protein
MPSFFEKLKKGMGVEEPTEETIETPEETVEKKVVKTVKKTRAKRPKKLEIKPATVKKEPEEEPEEIKEVVKLKVEEKEPSPSPIMENKEKGKWFEPEGQLAIDVYQTENHLVIQSAIAGVKPENLDISLEKDIITIKGCREKPFEMEIILLKNVIGALFPER